MSTPYQEYNVRLNKKNKNDGNTYITFIRHNLILNGLKIAYVITMYIKAYLLIADLTRNTEYSKIIRHFQILL